MATNRPRITYVNRPSLGYETRFLDRGIREILKNDPNFLFYYRVTYVGDKNGLNNFKLDVYRLVGDKLDYITTLSLGGEGVMIDLVIQEESDIFFSDPGQIENQGIYTYEYSEHYL